MARMGDRRVAYKVLLGRGKELLRRPRRRWKDNIIMHLEEMGLGPGLH